MAHVGYWFLVQIFQRNRLLYRCDIPNTVESPSGARWRLCRRRTDDQNISERPQRHRNGALVFDFRGTAVHSWIFLLWCMSGRHSYVSGFVKWFVSGYRFSDTGTVAPFKLPLQGLRVAFRDLNTSSLKADYSPHRLASGAAPVAESRLLRTHLSAGSQTKPQPSKSERDPSPGSTPPPRRQKCPMPSQQPNEDEPYNQIERRIRRRTAPSTKIGNPMI